MRKAQGLARGRSRRKQGNQQQGANEPAVGSAGANAANGPGGAAAGGADGPPAGPGGGAAAQMEQRRKPSTEEQALTAKNYRLAKELSELRVRHRDETKTVTRLTMENMNLASRCREAITHVAMLKKELAVQQRKVEELERQGPQTAALVADQQQRTVGMAAGAVPEIQRTSPTPPSSTKQSPPPKQRQQQRVSPDNDSPEKAEKKFVSGGASRVLAAKADRNAMAVATKRPTPAMDEFSDEENLDEVPADEMIGGDTRVDSALNKEDFFGEEPGRPAQHLPATPEKEDVVVPDSFSPSADVLIEDTVSSELSPSPKRGQPHKRKIHKGVDPDIGRPPSPVFSNAAMVKARTEMSTMSSIDAFEASFDTTFPTSFATAHKEGPAPSLDISFDVPDFSDPFYVASEDDGGNISFPDALGPSPTNASHSSQGRPSSVASQRGNPGAIYTQPTSDEAQRQPVNTLKSPKASNSSFSPDLFPSSPLSDLNQVQEGGEDEMEARYANSRSLQTPAVNGAGSLPQAPGPEKTGASTARARYDAALGAARANEESNRSNGTVNAPRSPGNPESIASKRELSNSASLVLKKLQQRRAKNASPTEDISKGSAGQEDQVPEQNDNTAPSSGSQFSVYGRDSKLAAIRASARRKALDGEAANAGTTVSGDYGPRRTPKNRTKGDAPGMFNATNPSPSSKYRTSGQRMLSPSTMSAELNNLDAMVQDHALTSPRNESEAAAATGAAATGRRSARSVKQPVSYAEPHLNTKVRKGHDFFPKGESGSNGTHVVSPSASPSTQQR